MAGPASALLLLLSLLPWWYLLPTLQQFVSLELPKQRMRGLRKWAVSLQVRVCLPTALTEVCRQESHSRESLKRVTHPSHTR